MSKWKSYDCDKCDNTFVLKWRLTKHKENHSRLRTKKCNYFNNKKPCPYKNIGCMLDHLLSEVCYFGKQGSNKLCPYQHEVHEPVDALEKDLNDKFDALTYDEKSESKKILCEKLCNNPMTITDATTKSTKNMSDVMYST